MKSSGFTLLELLIVVAIVGILAAVAIPQFMRSTDRSKEAEGRAAIDALLAAEVVYYREYGTFTTVATNLLTTVPTMRNWTVPNLAQSAGTVLTVSLNGNTAAHNHTTHFLRGILTDAGVRTVTNNSGA